MRAGGGAVKGTASPPNDISLLTPHYVASSTIFNNDKICRLLQTEDILHI